MQVEHDKGRAGILPALEQHEEDYLLWRDRRSGFDRRKLGSRDLESEQRSGQERRRPEPPEVIEYRRARTRLKEQLQAYQAIDVNRQRFISAVGLTVLTLVGIIFLLLLSPIRYITNCDMPPRPGVNWSNCLFSDRMLAGADLREANLHSSSLKGADLRKALLPSATLVYANLASANLSEANLSGAILRSANLRGADLSYAKLNYADLSYADLSDANLREASLEGAKLDYTVWPDRRECAPGSIGSCQ